MDGSCQSMGSITMELDKIKMITAVKTMNGLGITTKTISPVLLRLLKLYNDDWTLIEENNYRILTDALFDSQEAEAVQNAFTVNEEIEPPSKKQNLGLPEDRGSSNMDNAIRVFGNSIAQSSRSVSGNIANMDQHVSCPLVAKNKGLTNALHNPKKIKKRQLLSSGCNHVTTFQTTHDIAASSCGQVKVSLTCNRALGQRNFDYPNADEVLRYVETCYRKSYINEEDPFSMEKLLNRLCECYLKMGDGSISGQSSMSSSSGNFSQLESSVVSGRKRAVREVIDIANGTEPVKISLLNNNGDEDLSNFTYCPESIVYQDACVQISMARVSDEDCCAGCKGDCMSSSLPCACTRDTGGDFAYTAEGLLSENFLSSCLSMKHKSQNHEFFCNQTCPLERAKNADRPESCKGHILKKFIKECWRKCGCNMQCGNRVVQRGISRNLQVFFANGEKGWGVRTLEKLPAGAFICEFAGEILTNIELYERNERNKKNMSGKEKHTYPVLLDADWTTEAVVKDEDALCLDATYYGNVARFINHRCSDGNLVEVPVQIETSDRRYYHLAFFTSREVAAFEELTWDYGIDFDDHNHPIKAFKCRCESKYCRDTSSFKG